MAMQKLDHIPQPTCIRTMLPGNIHVLTYTEVSRRAVDELAQHILDIYHENQAELAKGETILSFLIDSRVGSQPIKYTLSRMRQTVGRIEGDHGTQIAIILSDNLMMNMLRTLSNQVMRRSDVLHIFGADEYEAAIAWLRPD